MASWLKLKPSLAGTGLLERMRSTAFALLGITAAMGLGLVALASQQGWPYLPALPIPAAPAEHGAVHDARVVTPSLIAAGPLELRIGTSDTGTSAQFAGFGGPKGPATAVPGSSHLSGSHQVGAQAVSPSSPGDGQPGGEGTGEAPPSQPVSETPAPAPAPTPTATPVSVPAPASTSTPVPATVAPSTSGAAPPVSSSSDDDQGHSSDQGHSHGQGHSYDQGHSYGQGHSSEQGHSYPQGGGSSGGRETAHQHWSHSPAPAPQPPLAAAAPESVPTQPAPPAVELPEGVGGRGYGSYGHGSSSGHPGR